MTVSGISLQIEVTLEAAAERTSSSLSSNKLIYKEINSSATTSAENPETI